MTNITLPDWFHKAPDDGMISLKELRPMLPWGSSTLNVETLVSKQVLPPPDKEFQAPKGARVTYYWKIGSLRRFLCLVNSEDTITYMSGTAFRDINRLKVEFLLMELMYGESRVKVFWDFNYCGKWHKIDIRNISFNQILEKVGE